MKKMLKCAILMVMFPHLFYFNFWTISGS
jgi:hypothetical protein